MFYQLFLNIKNNKYYEVLLKISCEKDIIVVVATLKKWIKGTKTTYHPVKPHNILPIAVVAGEVEALASLKEKGMLLLDEIFKEAINHKCWLQIIIRQNIAVIFIHDVWRLVICESIYGHISLQKFKLFNIFK